MPWCTKSSRHKTSPLWGNDLRIRLQLNVIVGSYSSSAERTRLESCSWGRPPTTGSRHTRRPHSCRTEHCWYGCRRSPEKPDTLHHARSIHRPDTPACTARRCTVSVLHVAQLKTNWKTPSCIRHHAAHWRRYGALGHCRPLPGAYTPIWQFLFTYPVPVGSGRPAVNTSTPHIYRKDENAE